ncbi:beta strand repeat-containing protein [Deinococcus hohokamensis]|uniref:Beta strand repeat-containing protein n=1 Tax=Deinococcus hohokamensis TaxID=309883 RepID=A0ABV9ICJ6_9DEIO
MTHFTRTMAGLTLALALSACGGNQAPAPGTIDLSGTGVSATATVGSTTTGAFSFKNGGGSDLTYSASVTYPAGQASGWLNFSGADATGTVKAGETKTATVNVTCQPYAGTYAATVTLLSTDGSVSKHLPVTLNCTAEANIPDNAPVLTVKAEATSVTTNSAHITGTATDNVQIQRVTYKLNGGAESAVQGLTFSKNVALDFVVAGLKEGANEVVVTAYDTSNNATPKTLAVTYTAPVTPPSDTKAPALTVPADQLTNASQYTLSGSVTDEGGSNVKNVTYTVSKNGSAASAPATATLSGSGYSLNLTDLSEGVYTVTLRAEDNAGNQSAPQTVRVTVDQTAPSVSAGDVTITDRLDGSAGVHVVAPDAVSVAYSTNGATFASVTGSSPFAFALGQAGTYPAGQHSVWIKATDAAGNSSAPVKYDFNIARYGDLTAPALTLQGAQLTKESALSVTGTASDAGGVKGLSYTVSKDGGAASAPSALTETNGVFSIELGGLTDGVYTVTVVAEDHNGNKSSAQTTITVDQTAPSFNAGDITVTDNHDGSATVSVSGAGSNTIWYSLDGVTYVQASGSTFSLPTSGVFTAGSYTVWVKQGDVAGNVSAPVSQTLVIAPYGDLAAPALTLQGAQLTKESALSVTGTVRDAGGVKGVSYTVSKDGGEASVVTGVTVTDGAFSLDLGGLTDGIYTVTVVAEDNNGNKSSAQTTVTVDQTAPVFAETDFTLTDNHDGSATVTVHPSETGAIWYSLDGVTYVQASGSTFNLPTSGVFTAGSYTVWVKQGDTAGNVSAPVSQTLVIAPYGDLTAPALTLKPAAPFNAGSVSVTGTASDASPLTVTYALSGQEAGTGTVAVNPQGAFLVNLSSLAEGSYTLTVTAQDSKGNRSEQATSFQVDRTAPVVSADQSDTEWRNTSFVAHFTASDALSGLSSSADENFELSVSADAPNSTDLVTVSREIKDNVGNIRSVSASARIDTVAPTIVAKAARNPDWNGWYGSDVAVSFVAADVLSGIAAGVADQVVTQTGEVKATVMDRAGNSATSEPLAIKIDKNGPAFGADLSAAAVPSADGGYDARVTGTLTDDTQVASVSASLNGAAAVPVTITASGTLVLDFNVLTLQDGPNTIVLRATDALGHTSQQDINVSAPDTSAPTFTSLEYALVDPGTLATRLRLFGTASDLVGVTRVSYVLNGGVETDLALTGAGTSISFDQTVNGLITGMNSLTMRVYDAAGNMDSQVKTFDITAADYVAPTISNFVAIYKGNSRNIGVTAAVTDMAPVGATAGIQTAVLKYTVAGVAKTVNVKNSISGDVLSVKLTGLPVGTQLTLMVTDLSGNVNTATTTIVKR